MGLCSEQTTACGTVSFSSHCGTQKRTQNRKQKGCRTLTYASLDILAPGLRVVFVGYNPSLVSYERRANYAGRNNRFYTVLYKSGLTDRQYQASEGQLLLTNFRYGFTNIVSRPTQRADELTPEDYALGRAILLSTLETWKPRVACYVGKGVYQALIRKKSGISWGFQTTSVIPRVRDFVAPSTSGLVRMSLEDMVSIYRELALFLKR